MNYGSAKWGIVKVMNVAEPIAALNPILAELLLHKFMPVLISSPERIRK
jgi:hypothetical protein